MPPQCLRPHAQRPPGISPAYRRVSRLFASPAPFLVRAHRSPLVLVVTGGSPMATQRKRGPHIQTFPGGSLRRSILTLAAFPSLSSSCLAPAPTCTRAYSQSAGRSHLPNLRPQGPSTLADRKCNTKPRCRSAFECPATERCRMKLSLNILCCLTAERQADKVLNADVPGAGRLGRAVEGTRFASMPCCTIIRRRAREGSHTAHTRQDENPCASLS